MASCYKGWYTPASWHQLMRMAGSLCARQGGISKGRGVRIDSALSLRPSPKIQVWAAALNVHAEARAGSLEAQHGSQQPCNSQA